MTTVIERTLPMPPRPIEKRWRNRLNINLPQEQRRRRRRRDPAPTGGRGNCVGPPPSTHEKEDWKFVRTKKKREKYDGRFQVPKTLGRAFLQRRCSSTRKIQRDHFFFLSFTYSRSLSPSLAVHYVIEAKSNKLRSWDWKQKKDVKILSKYAEKRGRHEDKNACADVSTATAWVVDCLVRSDAAALPASPSPTPLLVDHDTPYTHTHTHTPTSLSLSFGVCVWVSDGSICWMKKQRGWSLFRDTFMNAHPY